MRAIEKGTLAWVLAWAVIAPGPVAQAASRTVQFAGMIGGEYYTPVGVNYADFSFCQILVVNTGEADQTGMTVEFLAYNAGAKTTEVLTAGDQVMKRGTTSGEYSNTCASTATLKPDAFCLWRYATQSIPVDGRYTFCAGKVTIQDSSATSPGSVVATGSITHVQEALAIGGVLSSALYVSGTHVYTNTGSAPANLAEYSGFPFTYNKSIHNMNFYCWEACRNDSSPLNDTQCVEHCGGGGNNAWGSGYSEWSPASGIGWLIPSDSNPSPTPSIQIPGTKFGVPYGQLVVANAHYAGGLVMELQSGPMTQICSGNAAYWENGGDEFTHADGVDAHSIILGNTNENGPPERLLCSHRHAKDDLFFKVGSTASFPINGGLPF